MKVAAFNVENLFDRAKAFNENPGVSSPVVTAVAELNNIFEKTNYSIDDKNEIIRLFELLGFVKSDVGPFALIRKIRGKIVKRPREQPMEVVADGRDDWIGWAELKTEPVNDIAVLNTGRVIRDVDADVLAVIEAENRVLLNMFSDITLKKVNADRYSEIMLIDGNDKRGIDVGIMCKNDHRIMGIKSHIYDLNDDSRPIFSRDCPEYEILTPSGETVVVIPNHFKSKFGSNQAANDRRRRAQSVRTVEIYNELIANGQTNVIILGDLNDTPSSNPLEPLLNGTNLRDVSEHPSFDSGEFAGIGTFGLGNDNQKIDYLLVSPNLFGRITSSGLFRKGVWPGVQPKRWEVYDSIEKKIHVASDHHVIWAEINI